MLDGSGSDSGMTKMNRVERSTKQDYFSFRHKTINKQIVCYQGKILQKNQKNSPDEKINKEQKLSKDKLAST